MVGILYTVLKTLGAIAALTLIVPLMVWAGTGSWRRALRALREYWLIMGVMASIVCSVGMIAAALELMSAPVK
jgi:hypothetical protein